MKKLLLITLLGVCACSSDDSSSGPKGDEEYAKAVSQDMYETLLSDVDALHDAAVELQTAAPSPTDRGWSARDDEAAIAAMTAAWLRARAAYERTEGALAPLFPEIDAAIDARYEDLLHDGDPDPFDDRGVTGMHAIERILFVNTTPAAVVTLEESLPGYAPAAWPATAEEAAEFKAKLAKQLVLDTATLQSQWKSAWKTQKFFLQEAFGGLISLMNEQREKVNKAASEEEESRYAQRTMADIRDNLAGTRAAYEVFRAWVKSKEGGAVLDAEVEAAFDALDAAYATIDGDAFPPVPDTWKAEEAPSAEDLDTPFGRLFSTVHDAVDPNKAGSAVEAMNRVARLLGFPEYQEE